MSRAKAAAPASSARSKGRLAVFILVLVILTVAFHSTMLMIGLAMLPTMAAFVFDTDGSRQIVMPVGLLNAAGTLPGVFDLWTGRQSAGSVADLMHDPVNWLIAYCAAGLGWLIYFTVPAVINYVLAQRARAHIVELEARQAELRRVWGDEIRS